MRKGAYLTILAVLVSCGGGGGSNKGGAPTPTASPTASPTPSPSPGLRISNATCIPPDPTLVSGTLSLEAAFPNLPVVNSSMAMVQPVNDSSFWFLLSREGRVYHFENSSTADTLTEVLDISGKLASTSGTEYGFTGLAFHPNYPSDNRVFTLYNDGDNNARSTLSSFEVNTSTHIVDSSSENVLLTLDQPIAFHNGGDIAFGPDGMLYAAFGDGEFADEAQSTTNLYGAMIRIDVSTTPYSVPSSNPFSASTNHCDSTANSAGQDCPEIFAWGFRNPWRFSIDRETGDIWLGDVGETSLEEINRVTLSGNYGWPVMEGNTCSGGGSCDTSAYSAPIVAYPHAGAASVVGGYVYRGSQSPSLANRYIYGDIYQGTYSAVPYDAPPNTDPSPLLNSAPSAFGLAQGNDGEVYILNAFSSEATGETIFRFSDDSTSAYSMPDLLSETGCFDTSAKTSADGVFEYTNINPLWSDGAEKLRAFAIPDNTEIVLRSDGEFGLPTDTVLIKHFLHNNAYLETRLLVRHPSGWQGYSYEWNDAQSDAMLLSAGKTKDVGGYEHIYPSPNQCSACHIGDDANLGVEALQLNREYEPLAMNILDYLDTAGYFAAPQSSETLPRLHALDDDSATLEQRARSYLHSNCSGCHRPDTGNRVDIDFRFATSLSDTNTCNVDAELGDLGVSGAQRIAAGNADASVVVLRMEATDSNRMPRLATNVVHDEAVQLIREWINGLSSCD